MHNREIAAELVLAEATVKRHMESVLAKLGVHSRHQAAEIYLREMAENATET